MLDGTVEMDKNGETLKFNWAGRMVLMRRVWKRRNPRLRATRFGW